MGERKITVSTKDGKITLDIPGEGTHCDQEMDQIVARMQAKGFIPQERINHTRKSKQELETINQ